MNGFKKPSGLPPLASRTSFSLAKIAATTGHAADVPPAQENVFVSRRHIDTDTGAIVGRVGSGGLPLGGLPFVAVGLVWLKLDC